MLPTSNKNSGFGRFFYYISGMKLKIALLLGTSLLMSCTGPGNDFRSRIAALDWGSDTCYVFGHKTPDVDAVCSAIAYAGLMRELGYKCEARVCGNVNKETRFASGVFGFSIPPVIESVAPGTRVILTDHSEYVQSPDGVRDARILQLIDHHIPGDIDTTSIPFVRVSRIGSACTLIWELFGEAGVEPSDSCCKALLSGIMSDTHNLSKKGISRRDTLAWLDLAEKLQLSPDELKQISEGMAEASHSYEGMSDEEIFLSDVKSYNIHGLAVRVGSVDWPEASTADIFMDRMLTTMGTIAEEGEMLFAKVDVSGEGCYILYSGPGAEQAASRAFGKPVRSGVCFSASKLNRKAHVIPMITKALE